MERLSISLLGTFAVAIDETPITAFPSDKVRALLAYLALEDDRPHRRETLATLLWPNLATARRNLRQVLYDLRHVLTPSPGVESPWLLVSRRDVQFHADGGAWLDVNSCTALLDASQSHAHRDLETCDTCMAHVQQAAELYRGDFLAGLTLADSDIFEDWRLEKQEALHRRMMDALTHLATYHERRGAYAEAIRTLRHQLHLANWREDVHRQLMRVLAFSGERQAALQQYEACRSIVSGELGVVLEAETTALYKRIQQGVLQPLPIDSISPYKGLYAFTHLDADDFFGRETFTAQLLMAVRAQPLVAVIGPSGSGKSSVVHAGLFPRMSVAPEADAASSDDRHWLVAHCRSSGAPFHAVAESLAPLLTPVAQTSERLLQAQTQELAKQLQSGELSLSDIANDILHRVSPRPLASTRVLLIIDQLEELYTLCPDAAVRQAFLDLLIPFAGSTPDDTGACTVLLTMRADFMGQAVSYRPFADALQGASLFLGPMQRDELHRAVEEPARKRRVVFEPGLVDRLLADVGNEPGNLPLLQFALALLWQQLVGEKLTHTAYEAIGGVTGALTGYAESVYAQLNPDEQTRVERILPQLVCPGEGTEDTRQVVNRADFAESDWQLLRKLADDRLVVMDQNSVGQETAEIVHEALIRHWGRLADWLDADRDFYTWRQQLHGHLQQWFINREDDGALLRGTPLAVAETWLNVRAAELSEAEQRFIRASLALRDTERQRERDQMRMLARTAALAQSLHLAANARLALNERNTDLALSLALEANRIENPPSPARLMLADAAYSPGTSRVFTGHKGSVLDVALSADGRLALSASADRTLALWDVDNGVMLRQFTGHDSAVTGVAFSPDGPTAISASDDQTLILWDLDTGQRLQRLTGHTGTIHDVALSPDGQYAVSAGADHATILWDVTRGGMVRHFSGHTGAVYCVAFSPDGQRVLSGSADRSVILWDVATGDIVYHFAGMDITEYPQGHLEEVRGVAFSPDGQAAMSVSFDQGSIFWDLVNGRPIQRYEYPRALLSAVALSPDGRYALLGTLDSRVAVLNLGQGERVLFLLGHTGRVQTVAFGPDGRTALSGSDDGTLRRWNLHSGLERRRWTYSDNFQALAVGHGAFQSLAGNVAKRQSGQRFWYGEGRFQAADCVDISPDGRMGLTGMCGGQIQLWDYHTGDEIRRLEGHTEMIHPGAYFRPDGQTVVSAAGHVFLDSQDRTIRLWEIDSGKELQRLEGHSQKIWRMALSPCGRYVASGSFDGTLRLWDLEQGTGRVLCEATPSWIICLAFSPDGRHILYGGARRHTYEALKLTYSLRLVDIDTGQELRRFIGHEEPVESVAFSPDGRFALSGSRDKRVMVWDVSTGQTLYRLDGHAAVKSVAYSPTGHLAAAGSYDGDIMLWDAASGDVLCHLIGHTGVIVRVVFTPNGQSLLSACPDDTVREWRVDSSPEELLSWIDTHRYVPELTPEQRQRYQLL